MVSMDAFASAFGFDAKSDDVWTTLGKVTGVSGNTLSVLLGGSATPTECESYCVATVGDIVFVVISKGVARAIAVKGIGLNGGLIARHAFVNAKAADNGVTTSTWPLNVQGVDSNGLRTTFFGEGVYPDGAIAAGLWAYNYDSNGNQVGNNSLTVGKNKDGTNYYSIGDKAAFRSALNIGTVKETDISSNVSVSTSTNKSIGSVSLEAGTWMVFFGVVFAGNSSGIRTVFMYTTADAAANAAWYRSTCVQCVPAGSSSAYLRGAFVAQPSSTLTYYLTAWQNSGSVINCTGNIQAVRIG